MARTAIVTGSDSGIGEATAIALARAGLDVGITWHTDEAGARSAAEKVSAAGTRAHVRRLDLEELPTAADTIDELAEALGGVDVFVNNAGVGRSAPFLEMSFEDWRYTLDVDLNGAFLCGQRRSHRQRHLGARARPPQASRGVLRCEGRARPAHEGHGARARGARHHG